MCCLCLPLAVLWSQVLHSSLEFILRWFLYMVWASDLVSLFLFCMWLSTFPKTIYWRDYPFSIMCSFFLWHKLTVHIYVGFFLSSQFCSIDLCIWFSENTLPFQYTVASQYSLKSGSVILPDLFFFPQDCFHYSGSFVIPYKLFLFFCSIPVGEKCFFGTLIGIALNGTHTTQQ